LLIAEYDYATDIVVQRAEERKIAYTEGKSLGLAEGSHQKALETAKKLLQFGLSVENIAQATGLSQAEVENINS